MTAHAIFNFDVIGDPWASICIEIPEGETARQQSGVAGEIAIHREIPDTTGAFRLWDVIDLDSLAAEAYQFGRDGLPPESIVGPDSTQPIEVSG